MRIIRPALALLAALSIPVLSSVAFAQGEGKPAPPAGDTPVRPSNDDAATEPGAAAGPSSATGEAALEPPPAPARETACSDSTDDDKDGATDCSDPDCAQDAACEPAAAPPATGAAPAAVPPALAADADKGVDEKPLDRALAIEGLIGLTTRVGSVSSGYDAMERSGLQYGLGVYFAPDRMLAFGVSYLYSGIGSEEFDPTVLDTGGRIDRRLHTVLVGARGYPLRSDSVGLWAGLGLGVTWQTAHASGSYATGGFPRSTRTYALDAGPQAGLALGASLGMDLDLTRDVAMLASANFTNHRLSSDPLEEGLPPAIPGTGAMSQLDFRVAFQYRFDVPGMPSAAHAELRTSSR